MSKIKIIKFSDIMKHPNHSLSPKDYIEEDTKKNHIQEKYDQGSKVIHKILDEMEIEVIAQMGYKNISGGFSEADITDQDNDFIYVELVHGIQNDTEDTIHTEQWKIDRTTLINYELN